MDMGFSIVIFVVFDVFLRVVVFDGVNSVCVFVLMFSIFCCFVFGMLFCGIKLSIFGVFLLYLMILKLFFFIVIIYLNVCINFFVVFVVGMWLLFVLVYFGLLILMCVWIFSS